MNTCTDYRILVNKPESSWLQNILRGLICWHSEQVKVHRHTKSPIGILSNPDARFTHIHLDIVEPLPVCQGYPHLLSIMDCFSCWPSAIPIKNTSAITVSKADPREYISILSTPNVVINWGSQFQSSLFREFNLLGRKRVRMTAYHPCTNGLVKRFYQMLKASLSTRNNTDNWVDDIPFILL